MKILTVYLPTKMLIYIEGQEGIKQITKFTVDGNFWYWQVVFADNHWLDITAPCILEYKPLKP